ncbi:MAG: hypothetical protein VYA77_01150, partial [Pseudomonadota bacterium]|nr:hypothetical protein [Pseudomonadota bacterium]
MTQQELPNHTDPLFQIAEKLSADFSLFPEYEDNAVDHKVKGLIAPQQCAIELDRLRKLNIDDYIQSVVAPSENPQRTDAKSIVQHLVV